MTDPQSPADQKASTGTSSFFVTAAVLVALIALASARDWSSTPAFHTATEAIAASTALLVGIISLVRHQSSDDNIFLFIGTGFLGTAILDGFHALVTADGISVYLPSAHSSLAAWSWLASRFLLSLCLYLSWLASKGPRDQRRVSDIVIYVGAGTLTLLSLVVVALVPLPECDYPELFLHRPAELIPALLFGFALFGYASKGSWRHDPFERLLICSLMVGCISQAVVVSQSRELYDAMFDLAHGLKIASYLLVFAGLSVSVYHALADVRRLNLAWHQSVQQLARANEGLEAFIRTASHDLKAPLRHVYSFCGFVREGAADRLTQREMEDLDRAMHAATRLSDLLRSLLGFAKLGATSLKHNTFSLTDVVDTVVAQLPAEKQSQVEYAQLCSVTGDQTLLTVVMQNLVENGLKYVKDQSPHVIVRSESTSQGTHVMVIDNGMGVDPKQSTRIFEPGIRGVSDGEFTGTGFGLATCARIITAHQGEIWVESNIDGGSTFHFTIPRA